MLMQPLAAWAAPLFNPQKAMPPGLITPLVILAVMAFLMGAKVKRPRTT
jgi:hypothetical protein